MAEAVSGCAHRSVERTSLDPVKESQVIIHDMEVSVKGRWLRTARLADEWHEDVADPASFIRGLAKAKVKADLFTF